MNPSTTSQDSSNQDFTEIDPLKIFIAEELRHVVRRLFVRGGMEGEVGTEQFEVLTLATLIERPKEKDYGDYALPCFKWSALLRTAPVALATSLEELWCEHAAKKGGGGWIAEARAVKGFVNFRLRAAPLADYIITTLLDSQMQHASYPSRGFASPMLQAHGRQQEESGAQAAKPGATPQVMLEFSQPNTHKEFHVGHTRNVCLGASLAALYRYSGFQVIAVNYIGDEGTHVAKTIWHMAREGQESPPAGVAAGVWCNRHYVKATKKLEEADEESRKLYEAEISAILGELEVKKGPYYQLWLSTKNLCMNDFRAIYQWLHISFDHYYYESELTDEAQKLVDHYLQRGVLEVSDGAVGLNLRHRDLGFMMVRKSDGNSLYITKDLALAQRKHREFPDLHRSLYVVGDEQNFHFQQLFAGLQAMAVTSADLCSHVSYGMVVRRKGKMASRLGNTIGFWELKDSIEESLQQRLEKYREQWSDEQTASTLRLLVEGTIKYGMLAQDPPKELTVEPDVWTSFEGKSGPYLMYAYARARSMLRKAGWCAEAEEEGAAVYARLEKICSASCWKLDDVTERQLLQSLGSSHEIIVKACEQHRPSVLCHYLFDLAKEFSQFYASCPVLALTDVQLREQRLALTWAFSSLLKQGLHLLGITPPEAM